MKIRVNFSFCQEWLQKKLKFILVKYFDIEECKDADFIFCDAFSDKEVITYKGVKIFYTGENIIPDFNLYDYAIGFCDFSFEDRYLRYPLYLMNTNRYDTARNRHINVNDNLKDRKFCAFLYSNPDSIPEREIFFKELSKYKKIDSGGGHLNNIGKKIENANDFLKEYKFSIAIENTVTNGYTTEKILNSFYANTIPIYFGNPKISEEFSSKAFINLHDFKSFDEAIEKIVELDNDDEKYLECLRQPIVCECNRYNYNTYEIDEFLKYICSQKLENAYRRNLRIWGKYDEKIYKGSQYCDYFNRDKLHVNFFKKLIGID